MAIYSFAYTISTHFRFSTKSLIIYYKYIESHCSNRIDTVIYYILHVLDHAANQSSFVKNWLEMVV